MAVTFKFLLVMVGLVVELIAEDPNSQQSLETFMKFATQRFENLERLLNEKDTKIMKLESKFESYVITKDIEIEKLKETLETFMKHDKPELIKDISIHEDKHSQNELHREEIGLRYNVLGKYNESQKVINTRALSTTGPLVAFYASMSTTRTFPNGNTIIYDQDSVDSGGGYNPGDGIFIVPVTGIYVITWTTIPNYFDYIQTHLMVNGNKRGSSYADSDEIHDIHPVTGIVVLSLNQGDHVFIRVGANTKHGVVLSDANHGTSSFSGWMLATYD